VWYGQPPYDRILVGVSRLTRELSVRLGIDVAVTGTLPSVRQGEAFRAAPVPNQTLRFRGGGNIGTPGMAKRMPPG